MGWPRDESWEVSLVVRVLETLWANSEYIDPRSGEKCHRITFTRERSIGRYETGKGKRFDFSVLVDNGEFRREFLIEVHGEQHYLRNLLGDRIRASDQLKERWAGMYETPLLVLSSHEIGRLHFEDELHAHICRFLGI